MGEWLLSRRDRLIVARHEVPGLGCREGSVPEGRPKSLSVPKIFVVGTELMPIQKHQVLLLKSSGPIQSSRWDGAIFLMFQALRAWLLSCCPSGTKTLFGIRGRARVRVRVRLGNDCEERENEPAGAGFFREPLSRTSSNRFRSSIVIALELGLVLGSGFTSDRAEILKSKNSPCSRLLGAGYGGSSRIGNSALGNHKVDIFEVWNL